MANTYVSNNVHIVFHTKTGGTTIAHDDEGSLYKYMAGIVNATGSHLIEIGGMPDHVHMLVSVTKTIALADLVRTIKAESSRWLKRYSPIYNQFAWQEGYGAFSVSASLKSKVIQYIRNQEHHHEKRTFAEEFKVSLFITPCPVAVPLPFGSLTWRGRCGYRGSARRWLAPPPAYSMSPVSRATTAPATPLTAGRTANGRARPLWPSEPTPCGPWRMRGWRHAGVALSAAPPPAP